MNEDKSDKCEQPTEGTLRPIEAKTLLAGGIAGVLASVCCLGPLVLVGLGLGGAWASNLTLLEPLRPMFLIVAVAALVFAYRKIFLAPAPSCEPGTICAAPKTQNTYKAVFWVVTALVLLSLGFPSLAPLFY
ncbi:mercuric ion transporter MerT [Methylocaldum sp. BRCS4]|jgi:mercuric ion transport protein|uniref:mercuric ion transporter MerT n=1 Tax=Methylocaldum sp. 14B TaxID=1912213 RepID=UPI00098B793C|nr:mercuric ion transporter MerT [Methylocaldum sp. 14B]MVF23089.1 mercuric ion transporter MerT [Methylocaldum sp. BRCS4]